MFNINDYIIYGGNGVCKVTNIGKIDTTRSSNDKLYYTLQPIYDSGKILTPVDNEKVVMRKLVNRTEIEDIIKENINEDVCWLDDNKERDQLFKHMISEFDCRQFMKIIKIILMRKKQCSAEGKKIPLADERYLKKAQDYLFGEFSVVLDIPKEDVNSYIKNAIRDYKKELNNLK